MRAKALTSPHPRGPRGRRSRPPRARTTRRAEAARLRRRGGRTGRYVRHGKGLWGHGSTVSPQGARRLPAGKQASARTGMPQRGGRVKPSEAPSDGPAARRAHPRSRRIRVRCRTHRPPSRARKAGTCRRFRPLLPKKSRFGNRQRAAQKDDLVFLEASFRKAPRNASEDCQTGSFLARRTVSRDKA